MTKSARHKKGTTRAGKTNPDSSSLLYIKRNSILFFVLLAISGLLFLVTRIKLLAIPLERDEGSFAYIGHWLFRGREMYTDMLDSKLPGLYTYYGVFTEIFGLHATGVHIGLMTANIASAICLFVLAKKLFNEIVAAMSTMIFLWMVVSPNFVGFAAHATQLLTPFVLGGCLLFYNALKRNKLILFFLAGLLIGIAFSIKQQSAVFGILLAALWWPVRLKWMPIPNKRVSIAEWLMLGLGGLVIPVVILGYFSLQGRLEPFLDWTMYQPMTLAGSYQQPWYEMFRNIIPQVIDQYELLWGIAVAGLVAVFLMRVPPFSKAFVITFSLLGFFSVIIGAAYYKHYFVLAIPGIALLAACSLSILVHRFRLIGTSISILLLIAVFAWSIHGRADYFFNPDFAKIHFQQYKQNMFPELEKIGKELANRVPEGGSIGVMGSEPEVLVAAQRESCSKYLMIYSILIDPVRSPPMQQEYLRELRECAPDYIVWATGTGSWAPGYDKLAFFEELLQWLEQNYETVCLAESQQDKPGLIMWDDEMTGHELKSNFVLFVLKKRAEPLPGSAG